MRRPLIGALAGVLLTVAARGAADVPEPKFDRIDYARPERYLDLPPKLGKRATIQKAAADIKPAAPRGKLAAIGSWISSHLRDDDSAAYSWRDFDRILADGTYGGCADHAETFGAMARACGIPTVWVKTMDADWIRMFRRNRDETRTWSGHVFLEVHLDGKWVLLDASQGVLYEDYDVRQRILPGDRYAYDKGGDPYDLILSTRWEEWKKQTRQHFADFDLTQLPVGRGTKLPTPGAVVVAGNNPAWQWAVDRASALGRPCGRGGNSGFDEWIPTARAGWLVVLCEGGSVFLPEKHRGLLPDGWKEASAKQPSGVLHRRIADGTRVVLVFGRDADALRAEIEKLSFDDSDSR